MLLRANLGPTRRLNEQLVAEHGLTVEEYEVLFRLARAPDMRMRRVDLSEQPLLTAANVTRLLEGLERSGLVERRSSAEDPHTAYAVLTDAGRAIVREATERHFDQVHELFGSLFDEDDNESLATLLARLTKSPGGEPTTMMP